MHLVIVLFSTMSHELEQPYVIFALEFYLQLVSCGGMTILFITC